MVVTEKFQGAHLPRDVETSLTYRCTELSNFIGSEAKGYCCPICFKDISGSSGSSHCQLYVATSKWRRDSNPRQHHPEFPSSSHSFESNFSCFRISLWFNFSGFWKKMLVLQKMEARLKKASLAMLNKKCKSKLIFARETKLLSHPKYFLPTLSARKERERRENRRERENR